MFLCDKCHDISVKNLAEMPNIDEWVHYDLGISFGPCETCDLTKMCLDCHMKPPYKERTWDKIEKELGIN